VVVRLRRHGAQVARTGRPTPVSRTRVLTLRLSKPLRPGRYVLRARARGVAPSAVHLRVVAFSGGGA
jgi:hypothetical protein